MTVQEWQTRLENTFGDDAFVGPSLLPIIAAEATYGVAVANTLGGFFAASSAFQSFYVDTLRLVESAPAPAGSKLYWPLVFLHLSAFRIFRGAESLFLRGYPFVGYSLLREVKDRAFMFAAIGRGETTLREACGWPAESADPGPFTTLDKKRMVKIRKGADSAIRRSTIGSISGFEAGAQARLASWNELFHSEVHGSTLSFAIDLQEWLPTGGPLPFASTTLHPTSVAIFVNRFEEAAWLTLRTLRFLQPSRDAFDGTWPHKWKILDESLAIMISGRPAPADAFGRVFTDLMAAKFAFLPANLFYVEPKENTALSATA